jgi:hypothetical protein
LRRFLRASWWHNPAPDTPEGKALRGRSGLASWLLKGDHTPTDRGAQRHRVATTRRERRRAPAPIPREDSYLTSKSGGMVFSSSIQSLGPPRSLTDT